MKKEEIQNTLNEEKNKSKKGLIILGIILFLALIGLAVFLLYKLNAGKLAEDNVRIKTKWGRRYYKELKSLDMKKVQERFLDMKVEDIEEVEVSFLHGYNTKYPTMVVNFVNNNETHSYVVSINHNDPKEGLMRDAFSSKFSLKVVYDDHVGGFDRTFKWLIDEGEYKGSREYYTLGYLARSYLPSSLIVYQKNEKSDLYEMYDVTDKVEEKAKFTYNLKNDSDKDLAKKINDTIDKVKYLEDYFTDKEIEEIKKAAQNKKIEIVEGKNKETASNSGSTNNGGSSSSKTDKCDPSKNPDYAINPCDCIERTKCPDSSWSLICSMEWCEKKITTIPKEECNDNAAKVYGTPAYGATSWSDYENACMVNIEATK